MGKQAPAGQTRISEQSRSQSAEPVLFKVLMHNDDYTTMEFVVLMLETVFRRPATEAQRIMLDTVAKSHYAVCATKQPNRQLPGVLAPARSLR